MPSELSWDDPVSYDSNSFWDEALPGTSPTPMKYKVIINYTNQTVLELLAIAKQCHLSLVEHAAVFASPPISMADFLIQITNLEEKIHARSSNSTADVLALKLARQQMDSTLNALAAYVNTRAKGDPTIVVQSSLPFYSTSRTPQPQPPQPPQNLRLTYGTGSGIIVARFNINKTYPASELQIHQGTPVQEEGWTTRGTYYNGRVTLSDLPVGMSVHVRVRCVGRDGALSNWSNHAQIIVV